MNKDQEERFDQLVLVVQLWRHLSRTVDVTTVLNTVDDDDFFVVEYLVDDPIVATPGRMKTFELP